MLVGVRRAYINSTLNEITQLFGYNPKEKVPFDYTTQPRVGRPRILIEVECD